MTTISICDFNDHAQCAAVVELMNIYMADEMGGKLPPHTGEMAHRLIAGLKDLPTALVLLAEYDGQYVGLCNSFINFGTFACKPFINVHDIVVKKEYRGLGIGRKLLENVIDHARSLDSGKVTLEVRADNINAQGLYKSLGFDESNPVMHFWSKYF